jgi:hypothetical protein
LRISGFAHDARGDLARLDGDRLVHDAPLLGVVTHLDVARDRKILAERMADEAVVGEDAAQVRMAVEHHAEQVERLALVPVHARPDFDQRGQHRNLFVGDHATHAQPPIVGEGLQVQHHGEAPARRHARPAIGRIVHAAQVHRLLEAQLGAVAQLQAGGEIGSGRHFDGQLAEPLHRREARLLQGIEQLLQPGAHRAIVGASISERWCWCA